MGGLRAHLITLLVVGFLMAEHVNGVLLPRLCVAPFFNDGILRPRSLDIVSKAVFTNKIAGGIWYNLITGIPADAAAITELELETSMDETNLTLVFKRYKVQGTFCVFNFTLTYDSVGGRLAQYTSSFGEYLTFISSNPDSYVWLYICSNFRESSNRCGIGATIVYLLTRQNGPDNFDYQLAGEDLMASTCLKMSGYPGQFEFRFTQGVNDCTV